MSADVKKRKNFTNIRAHFILRGMLDKKLRKQAGKMPVSTIPQPLLRLLNI